MKSRKLSTDPQGTAYLMGRLLDNLSSVYLHYELFVLAMPYLYGKI